MYKKTIKSSENQLGIGGGYALSEHLMSSLIGELLTLVEVLGLKPEQERSLKDLIKQKVWGTVRDMPFVESKLLTSVFHLVEELQNEAKSRNMMERSNSDSVMPISIIEGTYEVSFTEALPKE